MYVYIYIYIYIYIHISLIYNSLSLSLSADNEPTATKAPQHPLRAADDSLIRGGPHAERARHGQVAPVAKGWSALRDTSSNWGAPAPRLAQPIK